jgi:uncharacterized protein YpuA (DUF1002 family)
MEEDIKILEEHLNFIKNFDNGSEYIPALENLIKGYKEKDTEINKLNKVIDKMAEYMEQEFAEYQLDEIYASLYKCDGMERDWTRGEEEEIKDIKKFFMEKE